ELQATTRVREGYLLERAGRLAEARTLLADTHFDAAGRGAHLPAARAAALLIALQAGRTDGLATARRWANDGRSALARLGGDRPTSEMIDSNLAMVLLQEDRPGESAALLQRVLDRREREGVAPDWRSAAYTADLGLARFELGDHGAAEALLSEALSFRKTERGPDHPSVAESYEMLAMVADERGDPERSLQLSRAALRIRTRAFRDEHPIVAASLTNVASGLIALERFDEALSHLRRAEAIAAASLPAEHQHQAIIALAIGQCEAGLGHDAAAGTALRKARDIAGAVHGFEHPVVAQANVELSLIAH
ncbi:MAG: tetratricopeptide repeat protein, partial [Myxococcota bacterium]